jgi:hypothetical protein
MELNLANFSRQLCRPLQTQRWGVMDSPAASAFSHDTREVGWNCQRLFERSFRARSNEALANGRRETNVRPAPEL